MMLFLVFNVFAHDGDLAFAVRESTKTFLPRKFSFCKVIGVYPGGRVPFDFLN